MPWFRLRVTTENSNIYHKVSWRECVSQFFVFCVSVRSARAGPVAVVAVVVAERVDPGVPPASRGVVAAFPVVGRG